MASLADQYRAERAAQSGSLIYRATPAPPPRPQIYDNTPPKQLGDYRTSAPRSKYTQRPGESDHGFTARLQGIGLNHLADTLPVPELAAVAGAYNAAVERIASGALTHDQLRRSLDARNSGTGVGIMGRDASPHQRASALGSRHGGRQIERNGGLGTSVGPAPASVDLAAAWQRQNLPAFAQRPDIPSGSSGDGFVGVDRG